MELVSRVARAAPRWRTRAGAAARAAERLGAPAGDRLRAVITAAGAPAPLRAAAFETLLGLEVLGDPVGATRTGEALLPRVATSATAHLALAACYRRAYAIERPRALMTRAEELGDRSRLGAWMRARLEAEHRWLTEGLPLSPARPRRDRAEPRRVVYVVASGRPFHGSGYTTRTEALVAALGRRGWELHVLARAGYPSDRWDYPRWTLPAATHVTVGVPHRFAPTRAKLRYARALADYHREAAGVLERQCRELRPAVIHAASNHNCGLAAVEVGRRLGIPVIYEVRGLWHVSKAAATPRYAHTDHYRMIERLEVEAATHADHTFAITSGVADVLAAGGASRARLSILGNAADVAAFAPRPPDPELRARHRLDGRVVVGYVGTLNDYEGLDDLLAALAALRPRPALKLLVVGDGPARATLTAQARALGLADDVEFTGRVDDVRRHYSVIDIVVLPRKPALVCELVSPIKPFEAMAMERAVIVSDVAALTDVVADGDTGRRFAKGDRGDLARVLGELIADPAQRARLGASAARWTRARSWDAQAALVDDVYRRLAGTDDGVI